MIDTKNLWQVLDADGRLLGNYLPKDAADLLVDWMIHANCRITIRRYQAPQEAAQ